MGYDYEFVTAPPKALECPVCLLTLRDPHIISCCGNEFCQRCIERVQRDGKPCPLCNEPKFTTLLHKKHVREVNALMIRCIHKESGCSWVGEIGELHHHLQGCDYVNKAKYPRQCGAELPHHTHTPSPVARQSLERQIVSLTEELEKLRKVHQNELEAHKREVDQIHSQGLSQIKRSYRQDLQMSKRAHQSDVDELTAEIELMKVTFDRFKKENNKLKREHREMQCELAAQKDKFEQKCSILETHKVPLTVPPAYFTVYNVKHWMSIDYRWVSDPFYSHPGGYKMAFSVYLNGYSKGKGTHMGFFLGIQCGKFDDQLQWPFNGEIHVQLYDCETDQWDADTVFELKEGHVDDKCIHKPLRSGNLEWGYDEYLSHSELKKYIYKDDVLFIRVVSVKVINVQ